MISTCIDRLRLLNKIWEVPSGKLTWLLKMVIYSGFTHWKWWFSIVMLVYQRVGFGRDGRIERYRNLWFTQLCHMRRAIPKGIPTKHRWKSLTQFRRAQDTGAVVHVLWLTIATADRGPLRAGQQQVQWRPLRQLVVHFGVLASPPLYWTF